MSTVGGGVADYVVDVGIPTLGDTPFLVEAVESVRTQTFSGWRLLVLENGPGSARTRSELEPYLEDPRIRHVVTGATVDRGENWTNLIRVGSAPYIGILHDDDRWHPSYLERHVEFLEQHPSCGFVFSGFNVIDASGRALARSRPDVSAGVHSSASFLPRLYARCFIGPPTPLVRRTAYEAVGSQFADLLVVDWDMWLRLSARFDVGYIDAWDADYRFHGGQTSANRSTLGEHFLHVLEAGESLPVPASVRRQAQTKQLIVCALDAVERGERRVALRYLSRAARTDTIQVLRPKTAARSVAALAAIAAGGPGRRLLKKVRDRRWWRGGAEGFLPPFRDEPSEERTETARLGGNA